jgi:very-short-patch-repair endonuclease
VLEVAQEMRRALTPAELRLWNALRGKRLARLRFRSQHPVGPFVLDFYCAEHKLVVEVDGSVHQEPAQVVRDQARTERAEAYGYRVVRFTNEEVFGDLESVLENILAVVETP